MGKVVTSTVANRYDKKIWVKHDFQQHMVLAKRFALGGMVGGAGFDVGIHVDREKEFDRKEIELQFTPIQAGEFKRFDIPAEGNDVVFLTIITETGEILCNADPKKIDRNFVIMEGGQCRNGVKDTKRPFAIDDID